MPHTVRERISLKSLLDDLKKEVGYSQALLLSVVPRGGLQVAQPSNVPSRLVRAYNAGFEAEDRLSWSAITTGRPIKIGEVCNDEQLRNTPYWRELLMPRRLRWAVAVPLQSPILPGFPGVVHLCRTEEQADFKSSELETVRAAVGSFEQRNSMKSTVRNAVRDSLNSQASLVVLDESSRPLYGREIWSDFDGHLREQMSEMLGRRAHQLNGHGAVTSRIQLPDRNGDIWNFQVVTFRRYPALGDGTVTFFCLQPGCCQWGRVRPTDFQADPELARLIPSLRFMQQQYPKGPTLNDIAETAKLSPFHFHRRFTELLGLTPKQFMLDCQIHAAKTMLLAGDRQLTDIARECGFAHQSHFTSRFRQATGLTPTRWRRFAQERLKQSAN